MRTRWPIQTMTVGFCFLLCSLASASASPLSYRLNGHEVHVPAESARFVGPPGIFVTATQESLCSALEGAKWQLEGAQDAAPNRSVVRATSMQASPASAPPLDASVFYREDDEHAQRRTLRDKIVAWPVGRNRDGPGSIWFVRLVHARADARLRADAEIALHAIFLTGTSRLARAVAAQHGQKSVPWIRLRHAPLELRTVQDMAVSVGDDAPDKVAVEHEPQSSVQLTSCSETDAPDKKSYQPAPEAGPACEPRGRLPVHPLAAQQIATSVVWHASNLSATSKQVALTFDACSTFAIGRFNPRVVAMLRAYHVPATLFVGGHWAEMYPDVLEDLAQDPLFEIGNHTYSHPHMRDLSTQTQKQELLWTQQLIFARTGKVPKLFRPPYGEVDDALITSAAQSGLYTVEYDLPAGDADDNVTKAHLTNWVVGHSNPGSIVVMHMCRPNNHTADALPGIVQHLREQGYKFCQVSDMLFNGGKQCQ